MIGDEKNCGTNVQEQSTPILMSDVAGTSKKYQCIHTVKAKESLCLLATRYLGSGKRYTEIMKLNNKKTAAIAIGEKIKIPNK